MVLIGAEGSGQTYADEQGLGHEVKYALDRLAENLPGYHIGWNALPYPAAPADPAALLDPTYRKTFFASIDSGIHEAELVLKQRAIRCPQERYVLAGFSQGAMVMHRTIYRLSRNLTSGDSSTKLLPQVSAVFAIADGDKVENQGGTLLGNSSRTGYGVIWWKMVSQKFWPR